MVITICVSHSNGEIKTHRIVCENLIEGESLQSLALNEGIRIGGACGGLGLCTTCKVKVIEGADSLSRLTREEKEFRAQNLLKEDERLACQCSPTNDVTILVDT
jgi:ferredoxin